MGSLRRARARPRRRPLSHAPLLAARRAWRVLERRGHACGPPRRRAGSARRASRLRLRPSRAGRRDRERPAGVRLRRRAMACGRGDRPRAPPQRRGRGARRTRRAGVAGRLRARRGRARSRRMSAGPSTGWARSLRRRSRACSATSRARRARGEPRAAAEPRLVQGAVLRGTRCRRGDRGGPQGRRDVAAQGALGCLDPLDGAAQ